MFVKILGFDVRWVVTSNGCIPLGALATRGAPITYMYKNGARRRAEGTDVLAWHSALLPRYLRMLPYHRRMLPANSQDHLHSPCETQQHQWCSPSSSFKTASKSTVPSSRTKLALTPLPQRQNPPGEMVRTIQRKHSPPLFFPPPHNISLTSSFHRMKRKSSSKAKCTA